MTNYMVWYYLYSCSQSNRWKTVAITRFPYDSYFNTIYTEIGVDSTTKAEPIVLDGEYYRFYILIRMEDILSDSELKFVNTMQISIVYLKGIGGDYDGDTEQVKASFTNENNDELKDFINTKANFINIGY